jgi:hypothetical protein
MPARANLWTVLTACSLLGCATRDKPSGTLEPELGHSQPLPDEASPRPATAPRPADAPPLTEIWPEPEPESEQPSQPDEPPAATEAEPAIPPPEPVTEEDEALCRHITSVVLSESNNAAGLTSDQIDELIASCSVALAQDRRKLGEDEFRRRAKCVRKASTVEGFSACQPR